MTKPKLDHIEEFRTVLDNYTVSEKGKAVLEKLKLVLLRAPSGGGRNTIIRELIKTGQYENFITDTTRPPRENDGILEQNGVEYWFRDELELLKDLKDGLFIEAEIIHSQQVSGMSIREAQRAEEHGKIAISDIHFQGVDNVIKAKSDTHAIFITPPTYEEWVKRLKGRGDMSDEEFRQRYAGAVDDYEHALNNDYYKFVINDSYLHSAEHIRRIVETNDYPNGVNREAREVAEAVYKKLKQEL
jgi:guanylate kinase